MSHSEIENHLSIAGKELLRRLIEEHFAARGLGGVWKSVEGSDGIVRTYRQVRKRSLITVFGRVDINRTGYSSPGESTLYPLDAVLRLPPDAYSYGIRKMVALEVSKNSFTDAVDAVERYTGVKVAKRQAEELATKSATDFNDFYERSKEKFKDSESRRLPLIVLTTDGKGIVVRKQDLRDQTKTSAEKSSKKLDKRMSKGEKKNRKRMATVASVYSIERYVRTPESIICELSSERTKQKVDRPRPQSKRVWASLEKTQEEVISEIFVEALSRDSRKRKKWVCLVDGDPKQLKIIRRLSKKHDVNITVVLDIIHVIEYLWKAARVFFEETSREAERWVSQRLLEILRGNGGYVAGGMMRSATLKGINKTKRKPIDTCANYIKKYIKYLRYNEYLEEGMPIATGVIEGACRHLIKDRMDLTGARWSLSGAEAVLKLRSLKSSGDFDEYWLFHEEQEYIRNHHVHYKKPEILLELTRKAP